MINYDMPNSMINMIMPHISDLLMINIEENDITIYQDFVQKHKIGIPSGVKIKSKSRIYPVAIPDIGCGFRIVKFEGINKKDVINNKSLITTIDSFLKDSSELNLTQDRNITIEKMAYFGHGATSNLFTDSRIEKYENNGYFDIDKDHKYNSNIFPKDDSISLFNKYQGHFIELLEPLNVSDNSIYLLIHGGSSELAKNFQNYYYPLLAKLSYQNKWSTENEVLQGKFNIPRNNDMVQQYYNDVKLLLNFSTAYRDLFEYIIARIFKNELKKDFESTLLSDYFHTKLTITDEHIIHQRGIQHIEKSDLNQYVITGNYGVASILFKSNIDQFISHGIQVNTELCPELLGESEKLLSNNLINNKKDIEVLKKSSIAKITYDYYLTKDISLIDYLIPFYSFKEENLNEYKSRK